MLEPEVRHAIERQALRHGECDAALRQRPRGGLFALGGEFEQQGETLGRLLFGHQAGLPTSWVSASAGPGARSAT